MADNSVVLVGGGIAIVAAFAIAALSYMRAVEGISQVIREKQPPGWKRGLLDTFENPDGDPRQPFWNWWMIGLIFGLKRLDLDDDAYHKPLWRARAWLFASLLLLIAFILGLGWLTQDTAS